MVYFGKVNKGRIELESDAKLPEGARVRIEPIAENPDPLDDLGREAVDAGPEDLAAQHDHYIYGTTKRERDSQ